MAETCDNLLAGEFAQQCGHRPKQGVKRKWYVNWDDIDRVGTQLANRGTKITTLILKAGAKLYPAYGTKKVHNIEHAFAVGDFSNGYIHTDRFTILYRGENQIERIQELVDGARVVSISETIDQGLNGEIAFKVAGFESGMEIIEDNFNARENSGTTQIAVATMEGEEESTGLKMFLLAGGYDATVTWLEANTYVAPEEPAGP